jgi:hypothetical protein
MERVDYQMLDYRSRGGPVDVYSDVIARQSPESPLKTLEFRLIQVEQIVVNI